LAIDPDALPEGAMISWATDAVDGFSDPHLDIIRAGLPQLGLALKSASTLQMAQELLGVYLGHDAGRRVLSGEIERGSLQKIHAVICYFDLTGFTSLTERIPGDDLIAMLNDYFGLAVEVIEGRGGHVLKFMGDGMLAMFDHADTHTACSVALEAVTVLRSGLAAKNALRRADGLPTTDSTLALHCGEILYGNIGADARLDFTVIGPAVNLTARLSGMHRSVGRSIIVSESVKRHAGASGHDLVSLGRYMLRGVSEPQELFTIFDNR
jgi:adenylate cyclase